MYTMEFFARADEPTTILMGLFGANVNGHIFGAGPSQGTFVVKDFKVAFVAQNIKAGVLISPWGVDITPVLAFELLDLFLIDQLKSFINYL